MRVKHHEKQIESILNYLEELSFHYIEKIEERLVNGWIIIPRDFDEVKTKLKEARTQILELQKKHMGQRDKIAFVHFRISDLEITLEDIQDHHQLYVMQAYDATDNELPIPPQAPPTILPPSPVLSLSPMFDSQHFFPPEKISPPKDAETPVESPILISPSSSVGSSSPFRSTTPPPDYPFDKSILDNSLWIIPQPLGSEPVPEKPNESDAC
ncbi:hypothetical protein Tco_1172544 [Tanacetum coccineum]